MTDVINKNNAETEKILDKNIVLDRNIKLMNEEKEKLKLRIQKIVARKGNYDAQVKTCKKCHKEFKEKENFNWSCRTHQSDWGGEMWWCCGKKDKDAPGCKYSKHESKEDSDYEDKGVDDDQNEWLKKQRRCMCCKQLGHTIENCQRDPNIKTGKQNEIVSEMERLSNLKECRKLHAENIVNTTHFIKRAVMVP